MKLRKRLTTEIIQEKSNEIHNNEFLLLEEFVNVDTKILLKHKSCGYEWKSSIYGHIYQKYGCPKCNKNAKLDSDEYQRRSNELHNNEYLILEPYVNYKTKLLTRHLICGHEWMINPGNHLQNKRRCPNCHGGVKHTIEESQIKIDNVYGKDQFKLLEYNGFDKNTNKIKHLKCEYEFMTSIHNFIVSKTDCPKCNNFIRLTTEEVQRRSNELHDSEYLFLGEYTTFDGKILTKHLKCGYEWDMRIAGHLTQLNGCPNCHLPKGELIIARYLTKRNINFLQQHRFHDCRYKKTLPFDFYLSEFGILIEYDGEQHFREFKKWHGEDGFELQKIKDDIKTKYCLEKGLMLVRIKYTEKIENILEAIINI